MAFMHKLNAALYKTGISQAQLSRLSGISKSAISQYCSGKNCPSENRQSEIAEALGLGRDYFTADDPGPPEPDLKIQRLSVSEVAQLMGVSRAAVAKGLQEGVFPWGYAFHGRGDGWVYWINAKRFFEIERVACTKG